MSEVGWADGSAVPPRKRSLLDSLLISLIAALGAVTAFLLLLAPRFLIAAEDAVILFQFSRNLAQTGAITYIAHGPHAEGATDFLWMVWISAGMKLGIEPYWFVSFVNFSCALIMAMLLIRIAGQRITPIRVLFGVGCFALLPQLSAAIVGFSTLPFACLLVLLAWCLIRKDDVGLPIVALLLCLFRPDGVVFAVPMLAAALIISPGRRRRLALDFSLFVLPGVLYFLWRWHYFGRLLPLPFYVKSDTARFAHLFVAESVGGLAGWWVFSLIVLYPVLRGRLADLTNRAVLLCLVVLPNLFYVTMRLDQNIGYRFYIYIPVGIAVLVAMNWESLRGRRGFLLPLAFAAWLVCLFHVTFTQAHGLWGGQFTNRKDIAADLSRLPHGTVLTTEAGMVPYYSGWPTYDSWGLSTERFSQHLLQPSDVSALHPDLILVHTGGQIPECVVQSDWKVPASGRTWENMTRNLVAGIDPAKYELWLAPLGSSHRKLLHRSDRLDRSDYECWFVRRDDPLRSSIDQILVGQGALTYPQFLLALQHQEAADATGDRSVYGKLKKLWHSL